MSGRFSRSMFLALALSFTASVGLAADPPQGGDAAATQSHDDHHAADKTAMDPMSIDIDLALFTGVVFLLLLAVLKKFAWGPILDGLDQREQRIADHIAEVENNRLESQKMLADYESKLAKAQDEVRAIIEEARRDAETTKQEIIATARSEAAAEMARATRDVMTARDQALQELMQTSANLAVDLAGKIVQAKLNAGDHAKLIADSLAKFPAGTQN